MAKLSGAFRTSALACTTLRAAGRSLLSSSCFLRVKSMVQVRFGHKSRYLGPSPSATWACCGADGRSECKVHSSDFFYNNTCAYGEPMYLRMESENYVEPDPVSVMTDVFVNMGGQKKLPCNLFNVAYCPV